MQIVVRVEKADVPSHSAVCAATATAVVSLLADVRCRPDGDWWPAVDRWLAGRIRKHTRRARGAAWERVQTLPGLTVSCEGVEVRAFVPCPADAVPRDIARLQLQHFELADADHRSVVDPMAGQLVVSLCPDPVLSTGKAAAATAHAAQLAWMQMPDLQRSGWAAAGFQTVVEHPGSGRWTRLCQVADVAVGDAGFTEVAPGTVTALARWV